MSDGPKCASCGTRLVAGNNVIRINGTRWAHAGCEATIPAAGPIERGRLTIETTYSLDQAGQWSP